MNAFEIVGGKPLKGEIIPQGAKNEALQIISAVLLTEEKITISNIPDIKDVNKLIELVADLGVKVERINQDTYTFEASKINLDFFQSEAFRAKGGSLRGSIMIVGPLLASFGIKSWSPIKGISKNNFLFLNFFFSCKFPMKPIT
jgi:UDP-N-acetylglucosamine 1-carboxyvinyltransferase